MSRMRVSTSDGFIVTRKVERIVFYVAGFIASMVVFIPLSKQDYGDEKNIRKHIKKIRFCLFDNNINFIFA